MASAQNTTLRSPTAIVHLDYAPESISPPPSGDWTRFVCISDTHSHTFDVPPGDVLLHSGDLTGTGTLKGFQKTMEWLYELPHKTKIIIAGNHDLPLHKGWYDGNYYRWHGVAGKQELEPIMDLLRGPRAVQAGIVYLEDEEYSFQARNGGRTWSVYGSPWSPEFFNWAFNYARSEADGIISKFPRTDILLTHGPVHGIFDLTIGNDYAGCKSLAARLPTLRPRLHLAGHIHEARGAYIHSWDPANNFAIPAIQTEYLPPPEGDDMKLDISDGGTPVDAPNDGLERTVFVNAASWPSGKRSRVNGLKTPFGGPGFQPVIVDLKE